MNQSLSSRASRPFVALLTLAAIALGACSDRPDATQPTPQNPNALIICGPGCGGGGGGGGGSPPPPPPPPISISALSLPDNVVPVDGALRSYNATLTNTGASLSGVVAQGYMIQGSTRRAAGGLQVSCGAGTGVLPSGGCQISFSLSASNTGSGSGSFRSGIATFELDLTVGSFTTTRTIGVNLVPGSFSAGGSATVPLSGALYQFGVSTGTIGPQTISSLSYQATVIQGSAHRSAGAMPLACPGAGWGNLPPTALTCGQTIYSGVTNTNSGTGTLVPGPATFVVEFLQGTTVLNTKSWPVTLVDGRFTSVTTSPNPSRIGGGPQPFTVTVANAGASLPNVFVTGRIRSGAALQGSVSASINCGGGVNVLPAGNCTITGTYKADTIQSAPYLVPGPATLYLTLTFGSGSRIDSTAVPITLAALPTIGNVTINSSSTIGIPGTIASYTATIDNPGPPIPNATVMLKIFQGATNRFGISGPTGMDCGSGVGTIASGSCTFTSIYFASNAGPGSGDFVPGPATLQIQLSDAANGMVYTKLVPITLLGP